MSPPPSMSAVTAQVGSTPYSIMFYVTSSLTINYLYAPDNQTGQLYKEGQVTYKDDPVQLTKDWTSICAVTFQNDQIRLYYIGPLPSDSSQPILKELVFTNLAQQVPSGTINCPKPGNLDANGSAVLGTSRLQASVSSTSTDIKLFYQRGQSDQPWMAYVQNPQANTQATWQSLKIANSW